MSRRIAAAVATCVLLAAGCSQSGGSEAADPTTTRDRATTTTTARSTTSESSTTTSTTVPGVDPISWEECDGGFECATVTVPIDYEHPEGGTLEVGVVRRPAKDQDNRIGALFVNPGGPGASAVDYAEALPLPTALTDRFDIVGVDPRGVGRSTPLDCHSHLQEIYDVDPTIDAPEDKEAFLAASKAFVDECKEKHGALLPFLGTNDVARDMDKVREAMGDEKLSYLGYSYGTSIGQAYASLFPTRVRAMVLDGSIDLAKDGLTGAKEQASGFTLALNNFIKTCDTEGCGLDEPAGEVIDEVRAKAEERPIRANGVDRPATPGVVDLAIVTGLYDETLWPQLAGALERGAQGRGAALVRLADTYLNRDVDGTYPNGMEVYFAVDCLDQTFPRDPDAVMGAAKLVAATYPRIGEALVNDYVRCAMWPTPAKPLGPVPKATKGLPPVVVISTTGDPATPYPNGVAVAKQIPTGVLVTNVGEGHTIFAQGKSCIDDAVTAYFVDMKAPKDGMVCE